MGPAIALSHDDIDPGSIQVPKTMGHDDIDMNSVQVPKESMLDKEVPYIGGTPRGYIKGGLGALPTIGAYGGGILGGTAGSAAGPMGTVGGGLAGAAIGGGAGSHLKTMGEQYILGEDKKPGDYVDSDKQGVLGGAAQELGGQAISKGIGLVRGAPSMLKAAAQGPASAGEGAVYDPFMKMSRTPGASTEELAKLSQNPDNEMAPGFQQRLAQSMVGGAQKVADWAGKAKEMGGKAVDAIGVPLSLWHPHEAAPVYAAAKVIMSPTAQKAGGAAAKFAADSLENSPQLAGALYRKAKPDQ